MKSNELSYEILYNKYIIQNMLSSDIAKELGISKGKVLYNLHKYKIPIRNSNKGGFDISGKKKYLLTAIRPTGDKLEGEIVWEFLCDCGNSHIMKASFLGKTKSCGCLSVRRGKNHPHFRGYQDISYYKWNQIEKSALKRGWKLEFTIKELWELYIKQNKCCNLTNLPISFQDKTASLDRINSNIGYCLNNLQLLHVKVNYMKQDYIQDDFIYLCKLISQNSNLDIQNYSLQENRKSSNPRKSANYNKDKK